MPRPREKSIYTQLRDRICLLDYPPGTILREADIAAEFGVSRTPVREAFQRLAYGALVVSKSGVGTRVTSPDRDEIMDVYEMRLKLAELIGVLSPNPVTAESIEQMTRLRRRAEQLLDTFDAREYLHINHEIHFLIGSLIGNRTLRDLWDQLYFQSARVWYNHVQRHPREVACSLVREVREVEAALAEGDVVAVAYVQRNYIAYGYRRVIGDLKTCA